MPLVNFNDIQINYEIKGRGPRLLFIPGTASDLRQELNIFKSPLVEQFEVLSLDPRGIGQSNSPHPAPTMLDYATDIKLLLDYLGWKDIYCIGESFGGMIAQEFALNYPQYVKKLVLAVTSSGGKGGSSFPYHEFPILQMSLEERADCWVHCGDSRYNDSNWKETKSYKQQYDFYLQVFQLQKSNPNQKLFSERQLAARKRHDTFDRLPMLNMPTYICAGRYDRTAPQENQLALFQQITHARLTFFEGSHMLLWQDPFAFQSIACFCETKVEYSQVDG